MMDNKQRGIMFLIIIFAFIGLVLSSGSSYKSLIYKILNDYEEECLEYKIDSWIETYCCDWTRNNYCYKMINKTHSDYSYLSCDELVFWNVINKTVYNTTNVCLKYYLVRKSPNN